MQNNIRRDFQCLANTTALHIQEVGVCRLDHHWCGTEIRTPYSKFYYITGGEGFIRLHRSPETPVRLQPGWLYLLPSGLSYDFFCRGQLEKIYFHLNVFLSSGLDLFFGIDQILRLPLSRTRAAELRQLAESNDPADRFRLLGQLYEDVGQFSRLAQVQDKADRQYSPMTEQLFALLSAAPGGMTNAELAAQLSMPESTLSKRFRAETGMSIGAYRQLLTMNRARLLLALGEKSLRQIAEELGFCDQFYFSRWFRERENMSPSRYRKLYLQRDS